jgi:hypothetical protein
VTEICSICDEGKVIEELQKRIDATEMLVRDKENQVRMYVRELDKVRADLKVEKERVGIEAAVGDGMDKLAVKQRDAAQEQVVRLVESNEIMEKERDAALAITSDLKHQIADLLAENSRAIEESEDVQLMRSTNTDLAKEVERLQDALHLREVQTDKIDVAVSQLMEVMRWDESSRSALRALAQGLNKE